MTAPYTAHCSSPSMRVQKHELVFGTDVSGLEWKARLEREEGASHAPLGKENH